MPQVRLWIISLFLSLWSTASLAQGGDASYALGLASPGLENVLNLSPVRTCDADLEQASATHVRVCLKDAYQTSECKYQTFNCDFSGFDRFYVKNEEKNSQLISRSTSLSGIEMGSYGVMRSENFSVQSGGFGPCYAVGVVNRDCQSVGLGHFSALTWVDRSVDALFAAVHEAAECRDRISSSEFFVLLSLESYQKLDDYKYRRLICGIRSRYPQQKITVRTSRKTTYQADQVEIRKESGKIRVHLKRSGEFPSETKTRAWDLD